MSIIKLLVGEVAGEGGVGGEGWGWRFPNLTRVGAPHRYAEGAQAKCADA